MNPLITNKRIQKIQNDIDYVESIEKKKVNNIEDDDKKPAFK